MSEFTPSGWIPKMTKAQVRKYIQDMEEKRTKAKLKLEEAYLTWELSNENDLSDLDNKIDNL